MSTRTNPDAVLDLLGFIDKTIDNGDGGDWFWTNAEVMELLRDVRGKVAATQVQPSSTVDEGKLAEVIEQHAPGMDQTACYDGYCDCGVWNTSLEEHGKHRARAVAEWLQGDSK